MNPTTSPPPNGQPWQMTLYIMFTAQLLSMIGFAIPLPFLPFYVRELGITERLVAYWSGILMASGSLVMVFFSPLWGWIADRYGRKPMVERAMFGGAVITFAMGLVANVQQLLGLRLLSGAMTGTIPASIALVSTTVPARRLGYALGLMQVAVYLGLTLGPWIGGLLADAAGYRLTFKIGGGVLLAGGLLVLFGARERFCRPPETALQKSDRMASLLQCSGFPAMLALFFFFNCSVHFVVPVLPLFIESLCEPGCADVASTTGMLLAVSGGTSALSAGGIGYLGDRIGHKRVLTASLVLATASLVLHGLAQSIAQLVWLRIFYGLAVGGILPAMNALVGQLVPPASYGKAYGVVSSMICLGMAAGPFLGGIMASAWGYRWPFAAVGAIVALSLPILTRVPRPAGHTTSL
ncbi:MAG: MFS transporter [Syntrophales bacterium]|jgi:DHA1 family multidrug resistance protein-like MFS transporter|nr:MFS transporter [Syntrophales bacterium]